MSNTNTVALRDKLKSIEGEVGGLRDRKAAAVRDREEAVAKFTAVPGSPDQSHPSFKAARRAADEVNDLSVKLDEAVSTQSGVLKMLGEQVIDAPTGDPSRVDVRKAGGWLARELRKSLTTDNIGSIDDTATVFFDRLRETSVILASGAQILDIPTTSVKVPTLTGRIPAAEPVAELDPIPSADPPFQNRLIEPPKFAKVVTLSLEAFRDARPAHLAAVERELVNSIADGFDQAAFNGAALGVHPGILDTSGIIVIDAGATVSNLDAFADAIGALAANQATASAIYLHPARWAALTKLKKETDSNEPLVSAALAATGRPAASLLGVPVYVTTRVPTTKAIVAQADELLVVRRQNIETDVDETYRFDEAAVGFRTIARMQLVLVQPAAVAAITLPALA